MSRVTGRVGAASESVTEVGVGATLSRGAPLAPALLALAVGALLHLGLGEGRSLVAAAPTQSHAALQQSLLNLPLAARGPVARALGADQPAYRVSASRGGFSAANPAEGLAATFTTSGLSVSAGTAHVGLGLRAVGYGSVLTPVLPVAPHAHGNRVVYAHPGVGEWYANGPLGIEQGFTLSRAPAGPAVSPLTLSIALSGNTQAHLASGGQGVVLTHAGRSVLRYGGLAVTDARGHSLHSWLALTDGRMLLRIDATRARYPLRIDPLIQTAELTASDGAAGDFLGISVAMSGNVIVAGAPNHTGSHANQGEVYVFEELGSGWEQTAELTASDGALDTEIGSSVAVSGNTIVAGASGREEERGAVYVFEKSGGGPGWTQVAELTASDGAVANRLGFSVALSGNTVVAGAPVHKVHSEPAQGAVYVFEKPALGWKNGMQTAELTASNGALDDELGFSAAVSGNTIVAGAANYRAGRGLSDGAVYVFEKPGSVWANGTQTAQLNASNGELGDALGFSVVVSGNTIVAGAPEHKVGANMGAVYVFEKPASGWAGGTQTAELTASDGNESHSFGYSLALSGGTIVVGSPASLGAGELYLFAKSTPGWENAAQARAYPSSAGAGPDIGWSVSLAEGTVVAGELVHEVNSHSKQGAVFVFAGPPSIAIGSPVNGASYNQGQAVPAAYSCTVPEPVTVTACAGPVANGSAIDTQALGQHTFTVTARDSNGNTATQSVNYTVVAAPIVPPTAAPPTTPTAPATPAISSLSETAKTWREGNALAQITKNSQKKLPLGTTFSFALNEPASVTFSFTEPASGRKVKGKCIPQAKKNKSKHSCTLTVVAGTLTFSAHAATNMVRFEGPISKRKKLKPGSYTLLVTATASGKHSTTRTLHFTVAHG